MDLSYLQSIIYFKICLMDAAFIELANSEYNLICSKIIGNKNDSLSTNLRPLTRFWSVRLQLKRRKLLILFKSKKTFALGETPIKKFWTSNGGEIYFWRLAVNFHVNLIICAQAPIIHFWRQLLTLKQENWSCTLHAHLKIQLQIQKINKIMTVWWVWQRVNHFCIQMWWIYHDNWS